MNSFSFEDKGPRFTKLKPSLALRLLRLLTFERKKKGNLNTHIFIDSIGSSQPEEKCLNAAAAKDINTKYYIQ